MANEPPPPRRPGTGDPLTEREQEILALVAAGETTTAITRRLGISPGTVKSHLSNVYRKLGVRNRVQATRYYLDRYGTPPPAAGPSAAERIAALQARLDQLTPAATEVAQLRRELDELKRSL